MVAKYPKDIQNQHLTTAIVAVLVVGISLPGGGYSSELRAAVAIFAWAGLMAGLFFGGFPRDRLSTVALVSGAILAGLAVLSGVSVLWASDDGAALREAVRAALYLGIFALVVCTSRRGEARPWLHGLAIGIVVVGLLALLSRLIPGLPGGDEEIARFLPAAQGRLSYPIGYWNALAAICAVGVVLVTWLGVAARGVALRALSVAAIPMLGLTMYLTSSRGGLLSVVVGLVALVAIGPRRPALVGGFALGGIGAAMAILLVRSEPALLDGLTNSDARSQGAEMLAAIIAISLAVGGVRVLLDGAFERFDEAFEGIRVSPGALIAGLITVGLVAISVSNLPERFREFKEVPEAEGAGQGDFIASHLASGSGSGRWQYWGAAVDAFQDEPLHGIGAGAYVDYWNEHAPISRVTGDAHSLYVEQLGELGPLGLLLVLGFVFLGPVASLLRGAPSARFERAAAVAVAAAGAASAGIEWTWEVPAAFGLVVVAIGLLAGPALGPPLDERERPEQRGLSGWGVGALVLGWIVIVLSAAILLSEREIAESQEAARDGDLERAAEEARSAIALQPWASEPRLQLALAQESAGDLDAAADNAEEASDRAEDDWQVWLVRARIATEQGKIEEAEANLAEARRLNPRAPIFSSLSGPLKRAGPTSGG
jgi:O-antigen ligase/polysaccharide polymerase Wzy-like membrane protein